MTFTAADVIAVVDAQRARELARGLSNYASAEARLARGACLDRDPSSCWAMWPNRS